VRVLVTGAAGFIGRAVAECLVGEAMIEAVRLVDRTTPPCPDDPRFKACRADLTEPDARLLDGIDTVIHLASIPGGSAEVDPALSRRVNLDAPLALLETLDARAEPSRFVQASSIAVFGAIIDPVDDRTVPEPSLVYGAHKRMVEIALRDFHRRGRVSTIALRLPGIVARPRGNAGLKSAFMSEVFHAARAGEAFVMPVAPTATMWLMSAACVARNLVHAARLPAVGGQAVTLPALRVTAGDLVTALYGHDDAVGYAPDAALQANFGALPPLSVPLAEALGFCHDGTIEDLVRMALR
jgi:D-erythronate 2-dehydrogenase